MRDLVYIRALQRAWQILGGTEALSSHLGVRLERVRAWEKGFAPIPPDIFFRVVDILIGESTQDPEPTRAASPGS